MFSYFYLVMHKAVKSIGISSVVKISYIEKRGDNVAFSLLVMLCEEHA